MNLSIIMCLHMIVCLYVCMYACMHVCILYVYMYVCMYVCMCIVSITIQLQPSPGKALFCQPFHPSSSLPTLPALSAMTSTTTVYVKRELLELGEELGHGVFGSVLSGVYTTHERKVGMSREPHNYADMIMHNSHNSADTKQYHYFVNVNECNSYKLILDFLKSTHKLCTDQVSKYL